MPIAIEILELVDRAGAADELRIDVNGERWATVDRAGLATTLAALGTAYAAGGLAHVLRVRPRP